MKNAEPDTQIIFLIFLKSELIIPMSIKYFIQPKISEQLRPPPDSTNVSIISIKIYFFKKIKSKYKYYEFFKY